MLLSVQFLLGTEGLGAMSVVMEKTWKTGFVPKCDVRRSGRLMVALSVLAAGLALVPQEAAARPDAREMTCRQAQDLVRRSGAVVVTTGIFSYERFVSGKRWCENWETPRPATTRTSDAPKCAIGFKCVEPVFSPTRRDR